MASSIFFASVEGIVEFIGICHKLSDLKERYTVIL